MAKGAGEARGCCAAGVSHSEAGHFSPINYAYGTT